MNKYIKGIISSPTRLSLLVWLFFFVIGVILSHQERGLSFAMTEQYLKNIYSILLGSVFYGLHYAIIVLIVSSLIINASKKR